MSKLTDLIESKYIGSGHKSMRQFLQTLGITQQKFYNWRDGAVPEDKILIGISEKLGINFLQLVALARSNDVKGTAETRREWSKIASIIDKEKKGSERKMLS